LVVRVTTEIRAPAERVFDLARDVDVHTVSMRGHGEVAVAGRTSGLLELGEDVTWRARHFGIAMRLTARIVEFERPRRFRDSMIRGPFTRLDHEHRFHVRNGTTVMEDVFEFASPLGPVGRLVDRFILARYLERLLRARAGAIKAAAEAS
jgi:ligand-binding SRPBCC domain-containing protein